MTRSFAEYSVQEVTERQAIVNEDQAERSQAVTQELPPRQAVQQVRLSLQDIVADAEARLASKPDDFNAAVGRAEGYYMLGNLAKATEACRQAITIRPDNPAPYKLLFNALKLRGDAGRFRDFLVTVARESPNIGVAKTGNFGDQQDAAITRGLPSVQLATFDRSGSTSIMQTLRQSLGLPMIRLIFHEIPAVTSTERRTIIPEIYEIFARGGALAKEHLRPTPENLDIMRRYDQTRIVVHVRDPRQHLVSNARASEVRTNAESWNAQYDSLSQKIDGSLDKHFGFWMWWLGEWLKVSKECGGDIDVLFTSFEEFKTDPHGLFMKILDFYGIDRAIWSEVDEGKTTRNFRKGELEEWRDVLTPYQQERCWSLMPVELRERFGWVR